MTNTNWEEGFDKFTIDNKWSSDHYNELKFLFKSLLEQEKIKFLKDIMPGTNIVDWEDFKTEQEKFEYLGYCKYEEDLICKASKIGINLSK
jgi:hypothetical protein